MKEPFISVIVPTFNGQGTIAYLISSLLSQSYPKESYEIIFVDDGSSDRTMEVLSLFEAEFVPLGFNIIRLKNDKKGACSARNVAIRSSAGSLIAMTDQDVFLPPDWLRQIAASMDSGKTAGLYGDVTTDLENFVEPLNGTAVNAKYITANMAIRKEVLLEVGLFSDEFQFYRGDSDLAYKILERGYVIEHAPNVLVYHPLKKFRWGSLRSSFTTSTYDSLLYKKYPRLAGEDTLRQVVPRFTSEGLAFTLFMVVVVATATIVSISVAALSALALIAGAVAGLSVVRSTLKGKPWSMRIKAAFFSLIVYLPIVLGRLVGSLRYHKFIL